MDKVDVLKNKNNDIVVWDCTFYLYDEEGNEILNDDGSIKIFRAPNLDWSHISEYVELEDLEENN